MAFGGTIKLTGEQEYRRALQQISQGLKECSAQMKLTNATYDKNDKSVAAVTARSKDLSNTLELQGKKVDTMRGHYEKMAAQYAENAKKNDDLKKRYGEEKQKLEELERTVGKSSDEYKQQAKAVDELEQEYTKSQKSIDAQEKALSNARIELTKAEADYKKTERTLEQLDDDYEKVGKEAEESAEKASKWDKVKGIMSGVGTAVAASGAAISAVGGAMVKASVDVAGYADEIMTQSKVTGIATDDLQKYKYAAELVDVSVDTITGSLTKTTKSMQSAANGGKAAEAAYKKLGVSVKDANGNLRDNEDVFWDAIDALGKIENETERDATAMTIFGKSAKDLNPLILEGSDAMKQYAEEAENAGAVLSDEQLMNAGAFDDAMQMLKNGAGAAKNAIGTVLLPVLTDLATDGKDLLGTFTRGIQDANGDMSKIGDTIGNTLSQAVSKITEKLPEILKVATSIFSTLLTGITKELPNIVRAVVGVIPQLVQALLAAVPDLLDAAFECAAAIIEAFSDPQTISDLVNAVVDLIPKIIDSLIKGIPMLIKGAVQLFSAIILALPSIIQNLTQQLPKIITQMIELFLRNRIAFLQMAVQLFGALVEAIPQIVTELAGYLPELVSTLGEFFTGPALDLLKELWENIKEVFSVVGQWFGDKFKEAWEAIKSAFSKVGSWFGDRWNDIKSAFSNVGTWFRGKFSEAWEKIKGVFSNVGSFFGGIWNTIKEKFTAFGTKIGDAVGGAFKKGINSAISMVEGVINRAIGLINGAIGLINLIPGVNVGTVGTVALPRLARGGVVDRPTVVQVGEAGREAIVPLENNTQWIKRVAAEISANQGGGANYGETVKAFKQALREVHVELNGQRAGEFVIDTVTRAVYA